MKNKESYRDYGKELANEIYSSACAEFKEYSENQGFGRILKRIVKRSIDYLYATCTKEEFNLAINGMYNEFGNMGEFFPQLYILNTIKPKNIEEKKRDLIRSILKD